jgi:predicted metal-dependent peptidase
MEKDMSEVIDTKPKRKNRSSKFDNLIGPTDKKVDDAAREMLLGARVALLFRNSFFGNLATNLKLINADEWCGTAATDGRNFYYNSRFITKLRPGEVEFLFGHEVLHVVYDHMGRRGDREPRMWNVANDYAVNADLKRHRVGEFITSVPCLYEVKYDGKYSEQIYDDLMKNVKTVDLDKLIEALVDEHMDESEDGDGDGDGEGNGKRPGKMTQAEREQLRQEIKQNIISAAEGAAAGELPLGVKRLIGSITNPTMPWRELIQTNLTSAIKNDYSFAKPNRRGWHLDAIMPGMTPGEEIDVAIAIDMSGSISSDQARGFLSEIAGMMDMFNGYRLHVFCFDTDIYAVQEFNSDNLDSIEEYEPQGGGGTDFTAIFDHLKTRDVETKRVIVFTDGMPFGSWGDEDFCDTTWIIHGSNTIEPPFGSWAYMD